MSRLKRLRPVGTDEEHRRGIFRGHQVGEDGKAVVISPLQVVDDQYEPFALGKPTEHLSQRREPALSQLDALARGKLQRLSAELSEDGKHGRERAKMPRQELGGAIRREMAKVTIYLVNEVVERWVGDGVVLVALSREHKSRRRPSSHLIQKAMDERGLSNARWPTEVDEDGLSSTRLIAAPETPELWLPTDEGYLERIQLG
jgi:hypothetical protein